MKITRLPGAVPHQIGLFLLLNLELNQISLFCWMKLIFEEEKGGGHVIPIFCTYLLVGLKQGCILNLVEFGAEKKWGSVWCGCGFVVS